jgi:hypothetical protein
MPPSLLNRWTLLAPLLTLMATLAVSAASAQEARPVEHFGVGYVVNGPHQFVGFTGQVVSPRMGGIGLYVDAKFSHSSPRDDIEFDASLTAQQAETLYGDLVFRRESTWRSFNVAIIRPLIPELLAYVGVGRSSEVHFQNFVDTEGQRGISGYYWVEDPRNSGDRTNLLGGAFFRISPTLLVQFGVESKPRGMTIGGTYTFTR